MERSEERRRLKITSEALELIENRVKDKEKPVSLRDLVRVIEMKSRTLGRPKPRKIIISWVKSEEADAEPTTTRLRPQN